MPMIKSLVSGFLLMAATFIVGCTHAPEKIDRLPTDQGFTSGTCRVHANCPPGILCLYNQCERARPEFKCGLNGELGQIIGDCCSKSVGVPDANGISICLPNTQYRSVNGEYCRLDADCKSGKCNEQAGYCMPSKTTGETATSCLPGGAFSGGVDTECCSGGAAHGRCTPLKLNQRCVLDLDCGSGVCNQTVNPPRCWYPAN
ncbi:MAG: hypothetical protein V4692_13245 [Bdellovibrionota bacterium]